MPKSSENIVIRASKGKQMVLTLLKKGGRPMPVSKILAELKVQYNHTLNKSSVYRMLDKLAKLNIVNAFYLDGVQYFEMANSRHHHLSCVQCEDIYCIDSPVFSNIVSDEGMFELSANQVFTGVCHKCRNTQ